ncbi:MAG: hypothetical protein ACJA0N_001111 [Pseudohongiellaceae bacterium]|jgi:hypothetical protein
MTSLHNELDFWLDEQQTQQDPLIKQHLQEWADAKKPM